jgi:acetolactate synthase small subunit
MNLQQYLTPENMTLAAGVAGGVVALALVGLAIWNRRPISKGISSLWQNIFSQGGLFYLGMALFMLASVVEAGPVLNKIAMHGALWGYGGHMLVFAFDMIASVSLRARLNARRVFDTRGMKLQMWGIWLPALVSISANLAGAIQSFNANDFNHLFIFAWLLPLIGAVFPSMIVVLSLAADHLIDTTAINTKIDVEAFKKQEKKRIDILKVRLSTEQELLEEEKKIATIRSQRDQAQERPAQEWFFMRWLRPHVTPPMATIKGEIEQAVNDARKAQEQQANALARALSNVQQTLATITDRLQEFATFKAQLEQVASIAEGQRQQFTTFRSQFEEITSTVEHLTASLEALQVKHISREYEGSTRSEGSRRAKVVNLHTMATGSSGWATHLQETGEMNLGRKGRAFIFIAEYQRRNEGAEPTLPEIMEAVSCSQGSASHYRSDYRKMQEVQTGEVAATAGATNDHHPM